MLIYSNAATSENWATSAVLYNSTSNQHMAFKSENVLLLKQKKNPDNI